MYFLLHNLFSESWRCCGLEKQRHFESFEISLRYRAAILSRFSSFSSDKSYSEATMIKKKLLNIKKKGTFAMFQPQLACEALLMATLCFSAPIFA